METKRCAQCHKLLRAETHICSRCGYTFSEKKRKVITRDLTRPSLPPASPHRAGHYSGLHPEDQPYQSSMIAVQHPPVQEVEEITPLPEAVQEMSEQPTLPPFGDDAPTQISVRYDKPQTETRIPSVPYNEQQLEVPYVRRERPLLDTDGALPALYQTRQQRKTQTAKRTISLLLTLSCIFFLLASGILVYTLIAGKSTSSQGLKLTVNPPTVRASDRFTLSGSGFTPTTQVKFTYGTEKPLNDSMGHQLAKIVDRHNAFSVDVITPTSWGAGIYTIFATDEAQQASTSTSITVEAPSEAPPQLQLSTTHLDLGTNSAGTTSSKQITLKNVGGNTLTWQQKSDAPWLSAAPTGTNKYTFSGSEAVTITVNRSNLTPNSTHTGHITFAQKDGTNAIPLTVTMGVDAAPAVLNVSPLSLAFAATSTQSVPTQAVTLQNSSTKSLNWQASATTNDGANWLYIGATSGRIDSTQSQPLTVGVQAQALTAGSYQGAILLTGGASATINVSLTVLAAGDIVATPTTLNFTGLTQQSVASEFLTLQNTGGKTQTWTTSTTADTGNWLSITPQSGSVSAGTSAQIPVNINTAGLKANSYQGSITFTIGNNITIVPITLSLTTPLAAIISVPSTPLTFQTISGTNPVGQKLTITNTGNAVLNWTASESGNGATFAPLSVTKGSVSPQNSSSIQVNPSVATLPPGPLNTTITISDSDAGTTVVSQKVQVTVIIQGQAKISISPPNLSINASGTNPSTQTVTLTNTGTAPLDWSTTITMDSPVGGTWLSINTTSGKLAVGASTNIVISCDSTGLTNGASYQGTIQISDSDTGTTVASQKVSLTFNP